MSIDLSINPEKETERIAEFLREKVKKAGFHKVIVGLSGGIDSATSCCLAVKALGAENVLVGLFPYGNLHKEGLEDAKILIDHLKIQDSNVNLINIAPFVDPIIEISQGSDLKGVKGLTPLRKGNIMARMRMILLYDLAKKLNALVLGTENKTEHLLGYFTRFGDEASDIEPIRHLYKTEVKQLAEYLHIPENIINKAPTAGLWNGQTDEGEFGFTYKEADQILCLSFDKNLAVSEIEKAGFKKEMIVKVLEHVKRNKFKHELPFVLE